MQEGNFYPRVEQNLAGPSRTNYEGYLRAFWSTITLDAERRNRISTFQIIFKYVMQYIDLYFTGNGNWD